MPSNAIGGFLVDAGYSDNTPWDRFLRGNDRALTTAQLDGANTFLALKCSICHSGALLSDDDFHDVAVAQIGPGEGDGVSTHDDFGRMRVTGDPADLYRFRTSPATQRGAHRPVRPRRLDRVAARLRRALQRVRPQAARLRPDDARIRRCAEHSRPPHPPILLQRDPLLAGVVLTPELVDKLMAYMSALTDDGARDLSHLVPLRVPSGLPVQPARK